MDSGDNRFSDTGTFAEGLFDLKPDGLTLLKRIHAHNLRPAITLGSHIPLGLFEVGPLLYAAFLDHLTQCFLLLTLSSFLMAFDSLSSRTLRSCHKTRPFSSSSLSQALVVNQNQQQQPVGS